ncbi:unnamed protein product [Somion occarium]|uniref:DUF3445 domain-containing protein n=1 Tax=Somion occarium TaxID=3059160 RepID=A0ABP1EBG5_9APHY
MLQPLTWFELSFLACAALVASLLVYVRLTKKDSPLKGDVTVHSNSSDSSKPERPAGQWLPVQFDYPQVQPCAEDPLTLKPIPYRPFKWGEYHVTMGIRSMPWDEWIELDCQFQHYYKLREARIAARGDRVIRTLPARLGVGSAQLAAVELLHELAEYLFRRYPSMYTVSRYPREKSTYGWYGLGDIKDITIVPLNKTFTLADGDPLLTAALLTQDDLAIMVEGEDGRYYLQACALCNAGTWRLEDKIGLPLEEIHTRGGVPRYKSKLELSMGRFFRRMPVDKPVIRNNYSFQAVREDSDPTGLDYSELGWASTMKGDEDLLQSEGKRWLRDINGSLREVEDKSLMAVTPSMVWLRTERQTLRRLPISGAIVFTIRVYQTPVTQLVEEPGVPGRMASAIRSWPEDVAVYKAKSAFEGILDYLDECHNKQLEDGLLPVEGNPFPF